MDDRTDPTSHRRRRGEKFPGGRDAITSVARDQFAERGYELTTIRGVAKAVGVDPRLVMHFFPTKEELFIASVAVPEEATAALLATLHAPADEVATTITRAYVALWEAPDTAAQIRAIVRSASTSAEAATLLRAIFEHRTAAAAPPDIPLVAVRVAFAQLLGASLARYILRIPPLSDLPVEDFIAALVPAVKASLRPST